MTTLPPPEKGEVLFRHYGQKMLGEWLDQPPEMRKSWADLEADIDEKHPYWQDDMPVVMKAVRG